MTVALNLPTPVPATPSSYAQRQFERRHRSVGRVRRFVREEIADHVSDYRAEDVVVCASELATNALQHTPPGRQFRVCVTISADTLRLEVHDAGAGKPQVHEPSEDADHGRGLFLVAALADDWGTSPRDGLGKLVWAEFKLSAAKAERAPGPGRPEMA